MEDTSGNIAGICTDGARDDTTSIVDSSVEVVKAFFAAENRHESLAELMSYCASEDVRVKFEDIPSFSFLEMMQEMQRIFVSFPDFEVFYSSISKVEGVVVVEGFGASGTHSGEPYGPSGLPAIPTKDKHVVVDVSRLMMTVENSKITKVKIVTAGLTGPPAMYVGIGGTVPGIKAP